MSENKAMNGYGRTVFVNEKNENLTVLYRGPILPYSILGSGGGYLGQDYLDTITKIKIEKSVSFNIVPHDGCTSIQMVGSPDGLKKAFKTFISEQGIPLYVDLTNTSEGGYEVAEKVLEKSDIEFKKVKDRLVL